MLDARCAKDYYGKSCDPANVTPYAFHKRGESYLLLLPKSLPQCQIEHMLTFESCGDDPEIQDSFDSSCSGFMELLLTSRGFLNSLR